MIIAKICLDIFLLMIPNKLVEISEKRIWHSEPPQTDLNTTKYNIK